MKLRPRNIPKFQAGNKLWYSNIQEYNPSQYIWEYDTKAGLKKGDVRGGFKSPWASPTAGLDPGERIRLRNFLAATSKERIVVLSTHIVSDIEDIANHVMIMKDGELNRIVNKGEYDDLEELYVSIFMNEEAGHGII